VIFFFFTSDLNNSQTLKVFVLPESYETFALTDEM